jgi:TATA-binding protein-associated factor Taf7
MINSDYEEYSEDDEKYSEYDEKDNDEKESEDNDEESEDNDEEKSEEEYEDELNYKKQILKSFYNYLEVIIKSIDEKKHNKKIINKLYYIVDKYYKNNYDKEIQVNLKKKESNIFESFINKTIDINKRLIKAEDNTNSILILNNFITKTLIY